MQLESWQQHIKRERYFVTAFPEYSYLKAIEYLELSPTHVVSQIDLLISAKKSTEVRELNISLFEILEQTENEKI